MMRLNKAFFIRCKVYIDRARMYIGYIQFVMLVMVFLNAYKNRFSHVFDTHPAICIGIGLLVFLGGSLVIGWLDFRLGLFAEEQKRHTEVNPVIKELMDKIEEINKKIKS